MPLPPELTTARAGKPTKGKGKMIVIDGNSNSDYNNTTTNATTKKLAGAGGSFLTKYFLVVLFAFAVLSMVLNHQYAHHHSIHHGRQEDNNAVVSRLREFAKKDKNKNENKNENKSTDRQQLLRSIQEALAKQATHAPLDDDDDESQRKRKSKSGDENGSGNDNGNDNGNGNGNGNDHEAVHKDDDKDDDDDAGGNKNNNAGEHAALPTHTIANLNCAAYGGPSEEDAEEMVYWEDIPEDALHMSPFHLNHPENQNNNNNNNNDDDDNNNNKNENGVQSITQFLTFEPDMGGWNNIRMAMETVLALAFAMGRTLVLPPHQGMYLIDKGDGNQKNKFSFDHFFHMESISAEHVGLDIITTTEFLERCARGQIVDADGLPLTLPGGGRTDWDGLPNSEQRELTEWMRRHSGENLVDFDPQQCVVAFPASNSEEDSLDLASLPQQIFRSLGGGFPHYESYIGKPNPVDAPAIERLKEMAAERTKLCLYTPDLQKKQWVHFPVGMKTSDGNEARLLVHFYAFLFFQDWKQDLWMKRFVRDHVRYIDEIQCAAARVVAKLRNRIQTRTGGASKRFDTIHVRRGDFQYRETRIDADKILVQLQRVLDKNTTLYVATDERKKDFFRPLVDYFADVVFLDDFVESELKGVNTNYFGMIDQLIASRGDVFFGCWFSTFTGYINRLRGYHADDHQMPGYEQGIVPSFYYALPDRFDHMQEFWPIKKEFYAREFPASWRLIDASL